MGFVNLLKLCVGAESVEDLELWQKQNAGAWPAGQAVHVTRMWPKREQELLAGGSLYWVIRGVVLCRQRLTGLERVETGDGISRCALLLDPEIIRTEGAARRPFQGWRYLTAEEAPRDLPKGRSSREEALPPEMARALAEIGLH
ncbi:DUF1489 family protein [Pseudogemmobacter faecipullorum]|uniref:DUF1489 domain-containing protein n=1 Tax=Pseudogemmobacter faecipullorum TaxID=2755041 RepID=A0ABS8CR61_9RHOB|nr:DUF1489 domain-containing protein [Pseudogemmobacter faecipullorum]MCB5411894.1 DUF1489 domain-containing protein [Pseudogemmobacter faecipullorum]